MKTYAKYRKLTEITIPFVPYTYLPFLCDEKLSDVFLCYVSAVVYVVSILPLVCLIVSHVDWEASVAAAVKTN